MTPVSPLASAKSTVEALKNAASKPALRGNKQIQDSVEHISSALILLQLSSPSTESLKRLTSLLREPLIPLYIAFTDLTLRFCVAVFHVICKEKLGSGSGEEIRGSWQVVQGSLLSGVLDFLENNNTTENKSAVAAVLNPVLCDVYFPPSDPVSIKQCNASLRSTVYMLLSETVNLHPENQNKLRDPQILGGKRIGMILSHSKDFLAIESLLDLFASLLPSTNKTVAGREKRSRFIREVFDPQFFSYDQELVQILESISTNNWESTSLKLFDVFAKSSVDFPQPFQLQEIRACGKTFLQPKIVDRLYVDNRSFLANVDEDGAYETFQAPYSLVRGVKLSRSSSLQTSVIVYLTSPPIVGESPLKQPGKGEDIVMQFELQNEDVRRFVKSLQSRGLNKNILQAERKLSLANSPLRLAFDDQGRKLPGPATEEKIKTMQNICEPLGNDSIFPSDEPVLRVPTGSSPLPMAIACRPEPELSKPPSSVHHSKDVSSITITGMTSVSLPVVPPDTAVPALSLNTRLQHVAAFGTSDEELSDISEDDTNVSRPSTTALRSKTSSNGRNQVTNKAFEITSRVLARANARRVLDSEDESDTAIRKPKDIRRGAKKRAVDPDDDTEEPDAKSTRDIVNHDHSLVAVANLTERNTGVTAEQDKKLASLKAVSRIEMVPITGAGVGNAIKRKKSIPPPSALLAVDVSNLSSAPCSKPSDRKSNSHNLDIKSSATTNSVRAANDIGTLLPDISENLLNSAYNVPTLSNNTAARSTGARNAGLNVSTKAFELGMRTKAEVSLTRDGQDKLRVTKRKRGISEHVDSGHLSDEHDPGADNNSMKRPRNGSSNTNAKTAILGSGTAKDSKPTKRYGRKGRTSSPTTSSALDVDYNELPVPVSPPEKQHKQTNLHKNQAMAMKGKTGHIKSERVLAKTKAAEEMASRDSNKATQQVPKNITQGTSARLEAEETKDSSTRFGEGVKETPQEDFGQSNGSHLALRSAQVANGGVKVSFLLSDSEPKVKKVSQEPGRKLQIPPWDEPDFTKKSSVTSNGLANPTTVVQETATDAFDLVAACDDEWPSPIERDAISKVQLEPINARSSGADHPEKDLVMIDLTKDKSPIIHKTSPPPAKEEMSPDLVIERRKKSPIPLRRLNASSIFPRSPPNPDRGRHTVTFISPKRLVTPNADYREVSPTNNRQVSPIRDSQTALHGIKNGDPRVKRNVAYGIDTDMDFNEYDEQRTQNQDRENPLQDIVNIINEIQTVIVNKICLRFDNVKNNTRSGRDSILHEAAVDLQNMRAGYVRCFNALVDLEEEYTGYRRKVLDGFEDMQKINQEISQHLRQIIQDHDRFTLSKRFPTTLSSSPLPSILLKSNVTIWR